MITSYEMQRPILPLKTSAFPAWEDDEYRVQWEGLVFIDGILSGRPSIKVFVDELRRAGIYCSSLLLKGTFFAVVESRVTGDIYAFVDNSGLYQAFYSADRISTSFLKLVREEGCSAEDFDPEAVTEYLHFGNLFFYKTFFNSIKRIQGDDIIYASRTNEKVTVLKKDNSYPTLTANDGMGAFEEVFRKKALSLSNCNLSVDLTGGLDSRLVAVMLDHYGLNFETASSGGTSDYEDISISKDVAKALKHPFFGTLHSISSLEEDIRNSFYATDGLYDVLYYHRLYQLQKERSMRDVDTIVSGVGGEVFKDFWWQHEFPFYSRKKSNIEKLVDLRIMAFKPMRAVFTQAFAGSCDVMRGRLVEELSHYTLDTNTRTYDNIFVNVVMRDVAGRVLTSHSNYLQCYAPFLDLDLARIGFGLPRRERFFNMFHRKKLSGLHPEIAKIRTSENGISASYSMMDIMRDIPKYGSEKVGRLLIKLGVRKQKKFGSLNHLHFYDIARNMKMMSESIELLKDAGILDKKIGLKQLGNSYLGNFLSLGLLIRYIKQHN